MKNFFSVFSQALDSEETDFLNQRSKSKTFLQGQQLLCSEEKNQHIWVILSGRVEINFISQDGKLSFFGIKSVGSLLGEYSAFNDEFVSSNAYALEKVKVLKIKRNDFLLLLKNNEQALSVFLKHLTKELRLDSVRMLRHLNMKSELRFKSYLLEAKDEKGIIFIPTQEKLASYLGLERETLSRLLRKLKKDGFIEVSRGKIILKKSLDHI